MRREISPITPPDLSSPHLSSLKGKRVDEVAEHTLDVGEQMIAQWEALEPIVKAMTEKVQEYVNAGTIKGPEALKILQAVASVVDKVGRTGAQMLKTAEGQARLSVLLSGGVPKRAGADALSEKQMVDVVLTVARRLQKETGSCPVCTDKPAIETTAVPT